MDYNYHRNQLIKSHKTHPYIITALSMLDDVEDAVKNLCDEKITIKEYIDRISPYDKFLWSKKYEKVDKNETEKNPIKNIKNQKYASWREYKWAPIFYLVSKGLSGDWKQNTIQVIQNDKVVEMIYDSGYIGHKNVDGGLAIKTKLGLLPIVVVEDKGGNACSTTFGGVNGQGNRLHQSFPNTIFVFITDNNFNVGAKRGAEVGDNTNLIVLERGENRVKEYYPILKYERFEEVKNGLVAKLNTMTPSQILDYQVLKSKTTGTLMSKFKNGIFWNL
jgi:hypothetical protein